MSGAREAGEVQDVHIMYNRYNTGNTERTTFFAIHENRGRLFTILKNREITYTYMGRGWERGHLENPWGSHS